MCSSDLDEGKLSVADPVAKFLPEFAALKTPSGKPANLTIAQLLTHTSGLGYGVIDGDARFKKLYAKAGVVDLFTTESVTIRESVQRLAKLPKPAHW